MLNEPPNLQSTIPTNLQRAPSFPIVDKTQKSVAIHYILHIVKSHQTKNKQPKWK